MSSIKINSTFRAILIAINLISIIIQISSVAIQTIVGHKVSLPCKTNNLDEVLLILWYRQNSSIPFYKLDARNRHLFKAKQILTDKRLKNRIEFDVNSSVLKITEVEIQDEGDYRCRVEYKKSRSQLVEHSLKVIGPPEEVRIMNITGDELSGIIGPYDEYSNILLICEAKYGNPNPSLVWYHTGLLEVIIDESYTVITDGIVRNELILRKLERNDFMSELTCRASTNELYDPISTSVIIDMNLKPLNVVILTPKRALIVGQTAQYRCQSDGSRPPALIAWFIESEHLTEVNNSFINDGNSTLSVINFIPSLEHNEKYIICRAGNSKMPDSSIEDKALLEVNFLPKIQIQMNTESELLSEGKNVEISCKINSNPMFDQIIWIFNEKTIGSSDNIEIKDKNQTLILKNLKRNQSGKYQCMGYNVIGKTLSEEIDIDIKFSPVCKVGQKVFYTVIRNLINKIKCSVESNPTEDLQFKWFVNTSIELFELKSFETNGTTSVADYRPKTIMNYALLSCYAQNSIGIQAEPCVYQIKIENGPPESVRNCEFKNMSQTVLSIECLNGNNGGLKQTFFLEIFEMISERLHSNHSSSQPSFVIRNLVPRIYYKFIIYSANSKGRSNAIIYNSVIFQNDNRFKEKVFSPLLNGFIGIVVSIVIVFICIIIVIRIHTFIYKEDSDDQNSIKSHRKYCFTTKEIDRCESQDSDEDHEIADDIDRDESVGSEESTETIDPKNIKSVRNSGLEVLKRLTNTLRSTKYKSKELNENNGYKEVSDIETNKRCVTFARFDEITADIEINSQIDNQNLNNNDINSQIINDCSDEENDTFHENEEMIRIDIKTFITGAKLRNTL